jgi:tetratricopeptide (TPR) repeat protein
VNGGWTPIKYKHLGDEIAYYFAPRKFKKHLKNSSQAAECFNLFTSTGKKEYYQKAVKLNPTYRVADNNYGSLYLSLRKFSLAQDNFLRVLKVDPKSPACLLGLGNIASERRDFKKAKKYFSSTLNSENHRLFTKVKNQSLLGLAKAEFDLKNFKRAKELLFRCQTRQPLQPQSYYLLGRIFEKEKDFERSARLYQDAIRLGFGSIEPISRLLKVSSYLKEKNTINKYIIVRYNQFKKGFIRTKRLSLKKGKKIKGLRKIEEKMLAFEKRLEKIKPSTKRKES